MEEKIIKAGKIAAECKTFARSFVKKGAPLIEIAEKIESKIIELGGFPAFPVNTSINEVAAHYTPSHDDSGTAQGLIKIDLGVSVDGFIADTAFSLDLENSEENKKIIQAAELALENASKIIQSKKVETSTDDIGSEVKESIESFELNPIINLSGHQIEHYELHAGVSVPNFPDGRNMKLSKGLYAVEPFATPGLGKVKDGKPSGIYIVIDSKNIRSPISREILDFVLEEYKTLPFCSRWLVKKFGTKALFGLAQLEKNRNIHQFPQLIEVSKGKVAQAENTFLISKDKVIITTAEEK